MRHRAYSWGVEGLGFRVEGILGLWGLYRGNGKDNGNYYLGFRDRGFTAACCCNKNHMPRQVIGHNCEATLIHTMTQIYFRGSKSLSAIVSAFGTNICKMLYTCIGLLATRMLPSEPKTARLREIADSQKGPCSNMVSTRGPR